MQNNKNDTVFGIRIVADERMPPNTLLMAPRWPPVPGDKCVVALPDGSTKIINAE